MAAITYNDVQTAAITEYFNNGGTTTDFATPTMASRWVNQATTEIWAKLISTHISWFKLSEITIPIVAGVSDYAIDSRFHRLMFVAVRVGSTINDFVYQEVKPLNDDRDETLAKTRGLYANVSSLSFPSGFRWTPGDPALDSSGNFVQKIRLMPMPQNAFTVATWGQRRTVPIPVPPTAGTESTTYIDLPFEFFEPLVLRVVRSALRRDQVNVAEINADIKLLDELIFGIDGSGIQRQRAEKVKRTRI